MELWDSCSDALGKRVAESKLGHREDTVGMKLQTGFIEEKEREREPPSVNQAIV